MPFLVTPDTFMFGVADNRYIIFEAWVEVQGQVIFISTKINLEPVRQQSILTCNKHDVSTDQRINMNHLEFEISQIKLAKTKIWFSQYTTTWSLCSVIL